MKWFIILVIITIASSSVGQKKNNFIVSGYIQGKDTGWVYLNYIPIPNGKGILDSCKIRDGNFQFKGYVEEPTLANLTTFGFHEKIEPLNVGNFYLENTEIHVSLINHQFNNIQVSGSRNDSLYRKYIQLKKPINETLNSISDSLFAYRKKMKDANEKKDANEVLDHLNKQIHNLTTIENTTIQHGISIDKTFIKEYPNDQFSAVILNYLRTEWVSINEITNLYDNLSTAIKNSYLGKKIHEKIMIASNTNMTNAKQFIAKDNKGDTINLYNLMGKYILLEFSASWCLPCKQLLPIIKQIQKKYSDKLLIISISNQENEKEWTKDIHDNEITWPCIIENEGNPIISPVEKRITDMYGVQSIPSLILINNHLQIIGWYGGFYQSKQDFVTDLKQKLEAIFEQ
ncbi:TlpA disulfide reductase family protein [Hydrotalea sandarakina]|jgi:thiol-disulfide isomerase/thioredoxin|uniref:Thiol-disulfide isomerase/thioredoxin n=1 Tax=Hydrotalea sandarakina TaxID=1004304 RepID=A0A2W7RGH4_9BACT|nr:TlpA disulfide reductase family protein [Hydrotalea sandarakina]PZX59504.1 thiol-disulfide isomerase/thioredoxin [Hydrotalea sandarakina]